MLSPCSSLSLLVFCIFSSLLSQMTGGRLTVEGNAGQPREGFLGVKAFAGLSFDYDVELNGPQDAVVGYLYGESLTHHVLLHGATGAGVEEAAGGRPGHILYTYHKYFLMYSMERAGAHLSQVRKLPHTPP